MKFYKILLYDFTKFYEIISETMRNLHKYWSYCAQNCEITNAYVRYKNYTKYRFFISFA